MTSLLVDLPFKKDLKASDPGSNSNLYEKTKSTNNVYIIMKDTVKAFFFFSFLKTNSKNNFMKQMYIIVLLGQKHIEMQSISQ